MISKDELAYLAKISKIDLSEDEAEKFPKQLERTIEYIDILEQLSSDDQYVWRTTDKQKFDRRWFLKRAQDEIKCQTYMIF
jgi:aspartyl/glutamyl-tRNA(Asn/Gln) amidotransferase C subunit